MEARVQEVLAGRFTEEAAALARTAALMEGVSVSQAVRAAVVGWAKTLIRKRIESADGDREREDLRAEFDGNVDQ